MTVWRGVAVLMALSNNADPGQPGNTQQACKFSSPPPVVAAAGHAEKYICPFNRAMIARVNAAMARDRVGPSIPSNPNAVKETATLHTSANGRGSVRFYLFRYTAADGTDNLAMFDDATDVDVVLPPGDHHQDLLNGK